MTEVSRLLVLWRMSEVLDLEVTFDGPIATVKLNRPRQDNALRRRTWLELAGCLTDLAFDDAVRAVVLTAAGENFSVGAEAAELTSARACAQDARACQTAADNAAYASADCPKPTIAAINGSCLGVACDLAVACDFRIAGRSASFGIPMAELSDLYTPPSVRRLLCLVGLPAAKRFLFVSRPFDAGDALKWGLVHEVVADPEDSAHELALVLARNAPSVLAGAKAMLANPAMGFGQSAELGAVG